MPGAERLVRRELAVLVRRAVQVDIVSVARIEIVEASADQVDRAERHGPVRKAGIVEALRLAVEIVDQDDGGLRRLCGDETQKGDRAPSS